MLRINNLIGFGARRTSGIQLVGYKTSGYTGIPSGPFDISSGLSGGISDRAESGDFVIGVISRSGASGSNRALTITDGTNDYTLLGSELYSNDNDATNLRAGYKFITVDTSITFGMDLNITGDDSGVLCAYVLRGVNPTTPLDVAVQTATGINTFLVNAPAVTPVTPGAQIVVIGAGATQTGFYNNYDAPSDLVDFAARFQNGGTNPGRGALFRMGRKTDWVSGAFDPQVWTQSGGDSTGRSWAALTIALRPAA